MAGIKPLSNPHFDDCLSGYVELDGLLIQHVDHPGWEVDIYSLNHDRLLQVQVRRDILATLEFPIKLGRSNSLSSLAF